MRWHAIGLLAFSLIAADRPAPPIVKYPTRIDGELVYPRGYRLYVAPNSEEERIFLPKPYYGGMYFYDTRMRDLFGPRH